MFSVTTKSPVTFKLSLTVVSEVAFPMDTGTPDVAVPTVIPVAVFVVSIDITPDAFISTRSSELRTKSPVPASKVIPPAAWEAVSKSAPVPVFCDSRVSTPPDVLTEAFAVVSSWNVEEVKSKNVEEPSFEENLLQMRALQHF